METGSQGKSIHRLTTSSEHQFLDLVVGSSSSPQGFGAKYKITKRTHLKINNCPQTKRFLKSRQKNEPI
jgi:hypothetical protein